MSECLQFPWIPLRYPPDTPKHPPDISRELKISTDDNRRQQTPPDTLGYWQVLFEYVWCIHSPETRNFFFAGPFWNIKIYKCPYIRFTKIIRLRDFFVFECPSERNYKRQLQVITLYIFHSSLFVPSCMVIPPLISGAPLYDVLDHTNHTGCLKKTEF